MTRPTPRALPGRRAADAGNAGGSLTAVFGTPSSASAVMRELPLEVLRPNPEQPRKRFAKRALQALADSLRERGVLQPILVRPTTEGRYEIVAGERRWRAAAIAGLKTIPAFVRADTDDAAALELALIENAAREDLTPVEEARTLSTLINDLGLTQAALAKRVGRSRSDLANTLRLLDLPGAVLDLIGDGDLSKGHGKSLLSVSDPDRRVQLARRAASQRWSVRELERAIAAPPMRMSDNGARLAAVKALNARAADNSRFSVTVRGLEDGFTIRVATSDAEAAERVLSLLESESRPAE